MEILYDCAPGWIWRTIETCSQTCQKLILSSQKLSYRYFGAYSYEVGDLFVAEQKIPMEVYVGEQTEMYMVVEIQNCGETEEFPWEEFPEFRFHTRAISAPLSWITHICWKFMTF